MGLYFDTKEKYFDAVIAKYSEGMTAKEITKTIPVSKSTVYRWVEEHLGKEAKETPEGMVIPRTPSSVAKTIRAMNARIAELEKEVEDANAKNKALERIIAILNEYKMI